jgi:putative NADPH-quinone reductase
MYIILKAWADPLENDVSAAFGYEEHSYVDTEEEAKDIVSSGGKVTTKNYGWAATEGAPIFKYKKMKKFGEK